VRRLYDWVTHWASTPYAVPALFVLAVAESSFFPIPPDVLLIALAFEYPARAFYYAAVTSVGSVLGGIIGYAIGFFLWEAVGGFFMSHVFSPEIFAAVQSKYELYSFWVVFAAAFTPIPYKVFTIAAGVFGINFPGFVIASIVGRSLRFFIEATALYFFGPKAKPFVEKYFEWLALGFTVLLILGFVVLKNFH
jgi:membrane protein YqaA with SNARE-associated domain